MMIVRGTTPVLTVGMIKKGDNMNKITNAEYMINLLLDLLHENHIKVHALDTSDDDASLKAMICYNIDCPYKVGDKRAKCRQTETYTCNPTIRQCYECKREWLTNEIDE